MKVPFNTPARRWLVMSVAVALSLLYLGLTARQFAAAWLGNPRDIELTSQSNLTWAVRLDPGDAEYRDHLGRFYDLVSREPAGAIGQYKMAVQLNPHSATYWFDLASAYQVLGDTVNQSAALARAIQADSMTPDVAWQAANLYLVQGENDKALREFRVVLANDPTLVNPAMQFCWRIQPDVDVLLRDVVPPHSDANVAFLNLLEGDVNRILHDTFERPTDAEVLSPEQMQTNLAQVKKEVSATFKVWNALMQTHDDFERRRADEYIQFLLHSKVEEVDQAVLAWQQITERFKLSSYRPSPNNLIINGRFGLRLLNAGFDWRYETQAGVNLTLQPTDPKDPQSRRSLLIAFDGPGISDAGFYQLVPVQSNTTYDFSAHYRNDGEIEGAGGPHFTIQDVYNSAVYYESDVLKPLDKTPDDELLDPKLRKSVDGEFTTGPNSKLVVVKIRRLPAGSPIRGKLWVDDLHLVKKAS